MTTYTTAPLPPIDTLNDHTGFVILVFFVFIALLLIHAGTTSLRERLTALLTAFCVLVPGAYISWTFGEIKHYANTPVRATLVAPFLGGQRSTVYHSFYYVMYEVDGAQVTFRATPGIAYPKYAVLYRN